MKKNNNFKNIKQCFTLVMISPCIFNNSLNLGFTKKIEVIKIYLEMNQRGMYFSFLTEEE